MANKVAEYDLTGGVTMGQLKEKYPLPHFKMSASTRAGGVTHIKVYRTSGRDLAQTRESLTPQLD